MSRPIKWFWMLSKRLYKKPSFVVLLLLIPVCVAVFGVAAAQGSGFVSIVLAQTNADDALSSALIRELQNEQSMIRFTQASSVDAAMEEVKHGPADEAWIFPEDTAGEVERFVNGKSGYVVAVYTKEQSVSLRLSREKLSAVLYPYCAKAYYMDYIRANLPELSDLSEEQLALHFQQVKVDEELFVFGNAADGATESSGSYLTTPLRGLLAVLAVLCGMAATMYHLQDEAAGTFSHVKQRRKGLVAFGCVATAVFHLSVVLLVSLKAVSLAGNLVRETVILLLYTVCCASFSLLLGRLCGQLRFYAALVPPITVAMIAVCPVFFDFRRLMGWQLLFPPTYYVNALYDFAYCGYMAVYAAVCLCLSAGLYTLKTAAKSRLSERKYGE